MWTQPAVSDFVRSAACRVIALAAGFLSGGLAGDHVATRLERHRQEEVAQSAASAVMTEYATALAGLAEEISRYRQRKLKTAEDVRLGTLPMASRIERLNKAYGSVEQRRMPLLVALLGETSGDRGRALGCQLWRAEQVQWERVRPDLNELLANIIAAHQRALTDAEVERVRQEQSSGWGALEARLRDEAQRARRSVQSY